MMPLQLNREPTEWHQNRELKYRLSWKLVKGRCYWRKLQSLGRTSCFAVQEEWHMAFLSRLQKTQCGDKDSHSLPRVDDTLDALSGSAWFSTMDLQHGYWQVELDEKDREKTGSGLYHFKVMPMGLTNAPATCQRLMEMLLRGLPWKTCLVYLDDVLIYSRSFSEHLQHLEEILSRFQSSGLKLNPSKCCFARDQVQFLGHVVSKDVIQPDPRNVKSVQDRQLQK